MSDLNLNDFTHAKLEDYTFPGTDAAVIFIPGEDKPSAEVTEILTRSYEQRWFPMEGGHRVLIPYHFCNGHEELFEREIRGWNHEHCSFCDTGIGRGELCWTTPSGRGVYIFCKACKTKLKNKPWWKIW